MKIIEVPFTFISYLNLIFGTVPPERDLAEISDIIFYQGLPIIVNAAQ